MSNSIDPDYEPSHLDLSCLQKPIIIAYGSERVQFCLVHNCYLSVRLPTVSLFSYLFYDLSEYVMIALRRQCMF